MEDENSSQTEIERLLKENEKLKQRIDELQNSKGFVQIIYNDATNEEKEKINSVVEECLQIRQQKYEENNHNHEDENQEDSEEFNNFFIDTNGTEINDKDIEIAEPIPDEKSPTPQIKRGSCFNCGEDHRLVACPYPHDEAKIKRNMQLFQEATGLEQRYYKVLSTDSIHIGSLSTKLQEALDISPNEPPPYIERMHKLGYPPGYAQINRNTIKHSTDSIKIYNGDDDIDEQKDNEETIENVKDTNISYPICTCYMHSLYSYPGFNAPIPEGADPIKWPTPMSSDECLIHGSHNTETIQEMDTNKTIEELEADKDNSMHVENTNNNESNETTTTVDEHEHQVNINDNSNSNDNNNSNNNNNNNNNDDNDNDNNHNTLEFDSENTQSDVDSERNENQQNEIDNIYEYMDKEQ